MSDTGRRAGPPSRAQVALVVAPLATLIAVGYIGDALTTTLADEHPLLLVLLSARSRILVLTTNQLDAVSYFLAAGLRLTVSDPLFYLLGRWYGDAMISWVEKRWNTFGKGVRRLERVFAKAAHPLVFIAPNHYICLFAGTSGMKVPTFLIINVVGTLTRLYFIRRLGEAFNESIDAVLTLFADNRLPLFVISVALVMLVIWRDHRRGNNEIAAMLELADHPPDQAQHPI